jgi:hypothetical protein
MGVLTAVWAVQGVFYGLDQGSFWSGVSMTVSPIVCGWVVFLLSSWWIRRGGPHD